MLPFPSLFNSNYLSVSPWPSNLSLLLLDPRSMSTPVHQSLLLSQLTLSCLIPSSSSFLAILFPYNISFLVRILATPLPLQFFLPLQTFSLANSTFLAARLPFPVLFPAPLSCPSSSPIVLNLSELHLWSIFPQFLPSPLPVPLPISPLSSVHPFLLLSQLP